MHIDYCTGSSRASWDMLLQYAFCEGDNEQEWKANGGRPLMFEGLKSDDPIALQVVSTGCVCMCVTVYDVYKGRLYERNPPPCISR